MTQETRKILLDLTVRQAVVPHEGYVLLKLTHPTIPLPPMRPGQFVEVRVDGEPQTFLRRPISINFVSVERNELWLLVHAVGAGTRALARLREGQQLNVLLPLGNGFTLPAAPVTPVATTASGHYLLVGGGVGTAPLLYLGQQLAAKGGHPTFLLGARSASDLLQLDDFGRYGRVCMTTEDGSAGEQGFVTQHSLWQSAAFERIYTCGPKPMMMAVARMASAKAIPCEASLENMMACGLGACLCCVEDTVEGNVCVCKEGPVFPTERLKWA